MKNNRHQFVLTETTYLRELIPDLHKLEAKADKQPEKYKKRIWAVSTVIRRLICDNADRLRNGEKLSEPISETRKKIFNALSIK
jgi:hypothetical protein